MPADPALRGASPAAGAACRTGKRRIDPSREAATADHRCPDGGRHSARAPPPSIHGRHHPYILSTRPATPWLSRCGIILLGMTPYAPSITLSFRMQATRQGLIRTNVEWQQCCCRNAISDLKDQKTVGQIRALPKGAPAIAIADRERRHALVPILKKMAAILSSASGARTGRNRGNPWKRPGKPGFPPRLGLRRIAPRDHSKGMRERREWE